MKCKRCGGGLVKGRCTPCVREDLRRARVQEEEAMAENEVGPLPDDVDLEQAWRKGKGLKPMPAWVEKLWRLRMLLP